MGEMNWSVIKHFYEYMYTLIKVHSLSRPLDRRLPQSEDVTCDDATVSAD